MYYYAEFLRGMRALRVIAIILGILLTIAIVFRIWAFSAERNSPEAVYGMLQMSPTAHSTSKTLADGTVRTIVVDPVKRVHAIIDRRGSYFHVDVTMPDNSAMTHGTYTISDANIDEHTKGGIKHVVLTHDMGDAKIPIGILFGVASVFALIAATMLGGALAKENDGHLELAWTKPVSRERLALASIAVDLVTIVISQLAAVAVIVLACAMFVFPRFYATSNTPEFLAIVVLAPLAWYACLTAASASLKRGLGMVCGLGWLFALMIPAISGATSCRRAIGFESCSSNTLIGSIHWLFHTLTYIDPIAYLSFNGSLSNHGLQPVNAVGTLGFAAAMLAVLVIVYVALAVLQWRRVEA
jgi:hypothetical protein